MTIDRYAGGSGYAIVASDNPKPASKTLITFGIARLFSHTVEKPNGFWAYEHHFRREDGEDWRHA